MMGRNQDFRRGVLGLLLCVLSVAVAAGLYSTVSGLLCLLTGLLLLGLHCLIERQRYGKLRRLCEDLEALLLHGTALPIGDYREGELSVLANEVQKLTLGLSDARDAVQKDKEFLADSLADISHQLRTPLTAMNLTLSLLQAGEHDGEKQRQLLRDLRVLLHRTQWLVEALLKLSKLDAGTVQLSEERVSLHALLEQAAAPLAIGMELRQQSLSLPTQDCSLLCDPTWTAEAVGNILKNAMEHSPLGGQISVRMEDTPLFTKIEIQDEGEGFDPEDLPRLFERFYRGKGAEPQSCGIGLALARSILTAQNGSIQAVNTGTGGKFILKFYKQII